MVRRLGAEDQRVDLVATQVAFAIKGEASLVAQIQCCFIGSGDAPLPHAGSLDEPCHIPGWIFRNQIIIG